MQAGQASSARYSSNFNALKEYICKQLRADPPPAPPAMQVATLAVCDATPLNDIEWAVVDVETTGLSFKWNRVIDVAAVVLAKGSCSSASNAGQEDVCTALQTLVNPLPLYLARDSSASPALPPVPKRILELTGITREVPPCRLCFRLSLTLRSCSPRPRLSLRLRLLCPLHCARVFPPVCPSHVNDLASEPSHVALRPQRAL